MANAPKGTVRLIGDCLEVTFEHDIHVTHAFRGLGARRVALGVWRVPISRLDGLTRQLGGFDFDWEGPAGDAHAKQKLIEAKWRQDDDLGLRAKAGEPIFGNWIAPVDLMSHQRSAVEFLAARQGALLCDEQGLGKTLTCLVAFWLVREQGHASRLLVVCPNSLKHTWKNEVGRFFPSWTISIASGYKSTRQRAYDAEADIYIVNYESARSDQADLRLLMRRTPTVLACDESHHAKNGASRTARSLIFVRTAAERVWVMSGTPVPNRLDDAYSQVFLADGGRTLGTSDDFARRYGKGVDQQRAVTELKRALGPILMRRTKEEVLDLPPRVFEERYVELRGEQRALYDSFRTDVVKYIEGMSPTDFEAARTSVLVRLLRLSQIAANPRLVAPDFKGTSAKEAELDLVLEDLVGANGRKVVLWSYHVRSIEEFLGRYARFKPVAVYGKVGIDERAKAVDHFQNDPDTMLFVGNPQAAGVGLTLTAAHFAVYESLSWRYDLYAQSLDRIHRIGQSNSVTCISILAADTIDEAVLRRLHAKRDVAAKVLGDAKQPPPLNRQEILEMLSS